MNDNIKDKKPKKDLSEKLFFASKKIYSWWNRIAKMNEDDPFLLIFVKIMIRLTGVVILIALSPLAIIGFIIGVSSVL